MSRGLGGPQAADRSPLPPGPLSLSAPPSKDAPFLLVAAEVTVTSMPVRALSRLVRPSRHAVSAVLLTLFALSACPSSHADEKRTPQKETRPAQNVQRQAAPSGSLVIVGGGALPDTVRERF